MVFSRWKHGSNGVPWSEAQTTSPLTRQRSRRQRYRAHRSCILELDGEMTEPSPWMRPAPREPSKQLNAAAPRGQPQTRAVAAGIVLWTRRVSKLTHGYETMREAAMTAVPSIPIRPRLSRVDS